MLRFEEKMARGGDAALAETARFFMGQDPVHLALRKLARKLDELHLPYAIAGGMALVAHGYARTTVDVDVLVTSEALRTIHASLSGLGYVPPFSGSRNLRDVETGVRIEFLVSGQYPGDGKPKAVAFPDPAAVAVEIDGVKYIDLPRLIDLKLASGATNPARLRDLADVQELIRTLRLPARYAEQLDPSVRVNYAELWQAVADNPEPADGGPRLPI